MNCHIFRYLDAAPIQIYNDNIQQFRDVFLMDRVDTDNVRSRTGQDLGTDWREFNRELGNV